jgi:hypothetical protein
VNAIRRATVALSTVAFLLAPYAAGAQSTPQTQPDVLVVGGTPAGVAAAVTAARAGDSVELVSASNDLGGILTGAMMDQWDLNLAPDGSELQHGIVTEIYARLGDVFTPASAARTFADMIAAEPSIAVRYGEVPVAVASTVGPHGRTVDAVTFRDARSGATTTLGAPAVIDATDDADVAVLAGARYDLGRQDTGLDERTQAVTEMFTLEGVDWPRLADSYDVTRFGPGGVLGRRAWGYSLIARLYQPGFDGVVVRDLNLGLLPGGGVTVNAIDVCGIDGLDPRQRDDAKRQTEIEAPRLVTFLRARLPGFENVRVGAYAPDVYVRETRHIEGIERLTARDVWSGRVPSDSVALASYPLDLHPVDPSDEPAYAPERHVYGIPFGALVPEGLANVLLASPAISASHEAAGSARVIPTTIAEGEADALACVRASRDHVDIAQLAEQHFELAQLHARAARS